MKKRPEFQEIKTFEEFCKYYWYREELSQICKVLGLEYRGTKQELNSTIEEYFKGNFIKKTVIKKEKKKVENITLDTPLLECGFSFNAKFREYFSSLTGISPFKFNADMATSWRNMLNVYYGKSDYAKYDNSACEWNQFLKDFCSDESSLDYSNKLKVASILWKEVRNSKNEKKYSRELLDKYSRKVNEYRK